MLIKITSSGSFSLYGRADLFIGVRVELKKNETKIKGSLTLYPIRCGLLVYPEAMQVKQVVVCLLRVLLSYS